MTGIIRIMEEEEEEKEKEKEGKEKNVKKSCARCCKGVWGTRRVHKHWAVSAKINGGASMPREPELPQCRKKCCVDVMDCRVDLVDLRFFQAIICVNPK